MWTKLAALAFVLASMVLATMAMARYLDAPYYAKSNSTKQCAFIEYPDGTRVDCNEYDPDVFYVQIWVK